MEHVSSVLKSACLGYNSDDSQNDSQEGNILPDTIENTPQTSPIPFPASCTQLGIKKNATVTISSKLLYRSKQTKDCNILTPDAFHPHALEELPSENSYETGEQSIEAPAYSPITPRMGIKFGEGCDGFSGSPLVAPTPYMASDSSIEAPAFSPLTPKLPYTSNNTIANPVRFLQSPIPQMSPQTKELLGILEGCEDFDSDDSARDPDYKIDEVNDGSFSDNMSERSISIIENGKNQRSNTISTCNSGDVHRNLNYSGIESEHLIQAHPCNNMQEEDTIFHNPEQEVIVEEISSTRTNEENLPIDGETSGRPRKGRKRKYGQTREERKQRRYKNLPYVNSSNKQVDPKLFIDFNCGCAKKCHEKISVEDREAEFQKFYDLGSYHAQNMYIVACVKEQPVKRPYVSQNRSDVSKKRTYSRQYFLKGNAVCREMFVKTIQTTPKRIDTSLRKMRSDSITDKRGVNGGNNKVSAESEEFLISVIKKLPTYVSHYCREKVGETKFLRSDMTFSKIYQLYTDEANSAGVKSVSYAKAKQVFLTKFNLRTKPLNKDTCNKCDYFKNKKDVTTDEEEKNILIEEHKAHVKTAEDLQKRMKSDMALAKDDPYTETITYDLQKTLPLPRVPTNIVFYKRQLWVYNLGIHTGSDDQGHCNVWVEGEAGRGSQEVGSCLIKHLSQRLKPGVTQLILWSDSCGGQNRNIKLTIMLKALLNDHPSLQQISIRFLESGHSFLPNDTDFGKVECALKFQQRIYLPEEYMAIMSSCKKIKPLQVHRMKGNDFLGSGKLEKIITNRKKSITGEKVSWLKTKEILLRKEAMFSLFMRSSFDDSFIEVDLKKNTRGRSRFISQDMMEILWPNGKPIPVAKLNDIKSLMHLIPKDAQTFYNTLTSDNSVQDDVDGFSGVPDFEFENDDDGTVNVTE